MATETKPAVVEDAKMDPFEDYHEFEKFEADEVNFNLARGNTEYSQDGKSYYFTLAKRSKPGSTRLLRHAGDRFWNMNGSTKKIHDRNNGLVGSTSALTYMHGSNKKKAKKTKWVMHEYRVDQCFYDKLNLQATDLVLCCIQQSGRGEEINNIINSHKSLENHSQVIIPEAHMDMTMSRKRQRDHGGSLLLPANNEALANFNEDHDDNNSSINCANGEVPEKRSRRMANGCYHTSPSIAMPMHTPMAVHANVNYVNTGEIMGTQLLAPAVPLEDCLKKDDESFTLELEAILGSPAIETYVNTGEIMGNQPSPAVPLEDCLKEDDEKYELEFMDICRRYNSKTPPVVAYCY